MAQSASCDCDCCRQHSKLIGQHQPAPEKDSNNSHSDQIPVVTVNIHKGKPIRLQVKVLVPTQDHPNYNFVGKLLGPKGNSLKWLQEQTQTKMAILGKGSMRNKEKEEELRRLQDPKYNHLNEELHVEITAFAPAAEVYQRISNALFEIKRFLVPDYYDDIRQQQLRELGVIGADQGDNNCKFIGQSEVASPGPVDLPGANVHLGAIRNELHRLTTAYSCPAGEPDLIFDRVSPSYLPQIESVDLAAKERSSQLSCNFALKHDCGGINELQRYISKSMNYRASKSNPPCRNKPYARPAAMDQF